MYSADDAETNATLSSGSVLETSTYYFRDAQGNVMGVYEHKMDAENAVLEYKLIERNIYGSAQVGICKDTVDLNITNASGALTQATNYHARQLNHRQYSLSNHLGNVLTTLGDGKAPVDSNNDGVIDYYVAYIISASDYSPFGVELANRTWSVEEYRNGFQKQEMDKELWDGAMYYKYRVEDPRLGRFFSVDPLYAKYPYNSNYAFSENVVINAVELEGSESVITIVIDSPQNVAVATIYQKNGNIYGFGNGILLVHGTQSESGELKIDGHIYTPEMIITHKPVLQKNDYNCIWNWICDLAEKIDRDLNGGIPMTSEDAREDGIKQAETAEDNIEISLMTAALGGMTLESGKFNQISQLLIEDPKLMKNTEGMVELIKYISEANGIGQNMENSAHEMMVEIDRFKDQDNYNETFSHKAELKKTISIKETDDYRIYKLDGALHIGDRTYYKGDTLPTDK